MDDKRKESLLTKAEKKKFLISCGVCLVVAVMASFIILQIPSLQLLNFWKKDSNREEFSAVSKICELATLRCYYHDVAEYEKQPDGLFKYGLFQYGYKKFWLEYNGIVEVGIDAGVVQVNGPDENGVVRIYVPAAKILSVDADKESMSDPIVDTGVFTTITTAEQAAAFAEAQATMRENAETDNNILLQAQENAKELLKQYVLNVGEQTGRQYTVEWIQQPETNNLQKGA